MSGTALEPRSLVGKRGVLYTASSDRATSLALTGRNEAGVGDRVRRDFKVKVLYCGTYDQCQKKSLAFQREDHWRDEKGTESVSEDLSGEDQGKTQQHTGR
jgi:hypothetical protein